MPINPENLTWRQWYKLAGYHHSEMILMSSLRWNALRQAWQAGESPTEYKREKEAV